MLLPMNFTQHLLPFEHLVVLETFLSAPISQWVVALVIAGQYEWEGRSLQQYSKMQQHYCRRSGVRRY